MSTLEIPKQLLGELLSGLRERSAGAVESAAVIGGLLEADMWRSSCAYFHHDLDDDNASALSVTLSEQGKIRLYGLLARRHLRVIGTIHTHPASWVGLSDIDQRNQITSRVGSWSIVVPFYAAEWACDIERFGFHERTMNGWHELALAEVRQRVALITA